MAVSRRKKGERARGNKGRFDNNNNNNNNSSSSSSSNNTLYYNDKKYKETRVPSLTLCASMSVYICTLN